MKEEFDPCDISKQGQDAEWRRATQEARSKYELTVWRTYDALEHQKAHQIMCDEMDAAWDAYLIRSAN